MPCILVGTTRTSQEGGQIRGKPRYTAHGVPLTKISLGAHLVPRNKRIGISLVEVCERVGKSVMSVGKKAKKCYQMHFIAA